MTDSDKIQTLPLPFLERMKEMLGDDYDAFLKSYKNPRTYGLRVNTAKLSCQDFQALSPFPIRPIPWINTGYFYEEESRPAPVSYTHLTAAAFPHACLQTHTPAPLPFPEASLCSRIPPFPESPIPLWKKLPHPGRSGSPF